MSGQQKTQSSFLKYLIMIAFRLSTIFKFCSTRQLNYYRILNLQPGSSAQSIKQSYYDLAKTHHPDTNSDPQSMQKFIKINEAYQTLSDHRKRKIYDDSFDFKNNEEQLYRHKNKKQTFRKENEYSEPFNEHDEFFRKGENRIKPKRGEDVYEKVVISLQEAVKGLNKKFQIKRSVVCMDCDPTSLPKCFSCGGKGKVHIYSTHKDEQCAKCRGKGYKNGCMTCGGEGVISEICDEEMYIPKGVGNETVLRKEGSGGYGLRHKNGDLYVKVIIKKDEYYTVDGNNVRTTNYIPISAAVLGGTINVETLHGTVEVNIEPGTQSGDEKRLPNYGIPSLYSQRMGDQILSYRIRIPKVTDEAEKQIFNGLGVLK